MYAQIKTITAFIISMCFLAAPPAEAQMLKVTPDSILTGDRAELSLLVPLDAGEKIRFPQFEDTLIDGIEILEKKNPDTINNKLRHRYTITAFEDSTFIIPPFPFLIDGDTGQSLSLMLKVSYYRPDSAFMSKIDTSQAVPLADIKEPVNTPLSFAEFKERYGKLILIILAGMLILAAGIYIYIRRKQNKPIFAPAPPKVPPHVKALQALENIKEKGIPQGEKMRKFYDEVSYIIRVYIEERYAIPAPDYISFEIISALKQKTDIESKQIDNIEQLLQTADMVKFAKYSPALYISERNLKYAFDFVNKTKEIEEDDENSAVSGEHTQTNEE